MRFLLVLVASLLLSPTYVNAQKRVVDVTNQAPVAAATILDSAGNMVGYTTIDGVFSDFSDSAYPITICCIGYEPLIVAAPQEKPCEMTPTVYQLDEVVVVPVERNILKQIFYAREYFSISSENEATTFFVEHMVERFVSASDKSKFRGDESLQILESRCYSQLKVAGVDSVSVSNKSKFPSMLSILDLSNEPINAPELFKSQTDAAKIYEKAGKSGMSLIQKQGAQTFTQITDALAEQPNHTASPWFLKLLGFTMDINQLYMTQVYRANESGVYLPKDLIEAGFVMEADGVGATLRKVFNSEKPVDLRAMVELYLVDYAYLSKEEYKAERKNKTKTSQFIIPSTVPPLNSATEQLVVRAKAEAKSK